MAINVNMIPAQRRQELQPEIDPILHFVQEQVSRVSEAARRPLVQTQQALAAAKAAVNEEKRAKKLLKQEIKALRATARRQLNKQDIIDALEQLGTDDRREIMEAARRSLPDNTMQLATKKQKNTMMAAD
eukprot:TRINITY_DN55852_c0_g1_i1.p2 TRINITY_DN55852_c0_g1~~TRINITY_DN55852_c0_g1_i1.p2  ORF type:complete len:130 (+),score=52.56 TRINITY_DN55852_c0_g1_i1:87-476(+)